MFADVSASGPVLDALVPKPCAIQRASAALRQLVSGVSALHASGKLHRDLKSNNVLVTSAAVSWS